LATHDGDGNAISGSSRLLVISATVIALSAALVTIGLVILRDRDRGHALAGAGPAGEGIAGDTGDTLSDLGEAPDFTLRDRSGNDIGQLDLRGKVWVVDFIFTQCGSICPMMTARMAELQERLQDEPELYLVSISVDPERDTPERLQEYATTYGAGQRWFFLTGEWETIFDLCLNGFKLGLERRDAAELEPGQDPILHSKRFLLVDREGRMRGAYDGTSRDDLDLLTEHARRLLAEK
jgi:cytochrome oxidase Cu insertion factor (SCO1/SenC/PrrC family)